ncbi:MAG: hypothetical protein A3A28_02250 [Candidatus Sungbacteria bacterium RIFCSPLOWO2_01_FULL_47_32]|uniref:Uncharacterized protein n=1 Tax=Candidatus Sungbacteria bacterium RIFCSPHIGHO2_01_FULL_47_32 TaxID=1802264 RepID=A0A1G2K7K6_9BACT|nr:MAG: hypothetical protein A2633_05930 [Candidatus Sungbacteria bacterium RIFCSPHIGHO2_01_FULL_47_32]OGZ99591.1 MAG: hypothetical protein A3D57_01400 [Candidatus Sungbacteria bacterium RIFCSPHIGHO2_02_FULL_46_12]OHA06290.1 MAG: hypothetical protein A3A28_02250 [Candidatus Sungbacteria bacterium RIFCSPLOWO2_01_FULL_47_32]
MDRKDAEASRVPPCGTETPPHLLQAGPRSAKISVFVPRKPERQNNSGEARSARLGANTDELGTDVRTIREGRPRGGPLSAV